MLLYILFGCLMGLFIYFYIIFGTSLLSGGPAQIVFLPITVFRKKRISKESKQNETFESVIFGTNVIQRTWSGSQETSEVDTSVEGAPPASWPPRWLLDVHSKSSGSRLFQKSCSRRFHSVWTLFDILFLRNTEIAKKTIWAGPPVNRLVPKII